eukprot:822217-Amphidinium_carterae.1
MAGALELASSVLGQSCQEPWSLFRWPTQLTTSGDALRLLPPHLPKKSHNWLDVFNLFASKKIH